MKTKKLERLSEAKFQQLNAGTQGLVTGGGNPPDTTKPIGPILLPTTCVTTNRYGNDNQHEDNDD